jgi:hypothetical protein
MALKNYSIRLEEEEYEKLKKFLSEYGDADLNIGYVIRSYISDLNKVLPNIKKSSIGIRNNLALWSSTFRQMGRTIDIEDIVKGGSIIQQIKNASKEEGKNKIGN